MSKNIAVLLTALALSACVNDQIKNDPSFRVRAKELVAQMTLEEKLSQLTEESSEIERLDIPAYNWWNEILHGAARSQYPTTVFPQAIGMAACFDRESLRLMGDIASTEARAIYNEQVRKNEPGLRYHGLTFWTPNVNIFRDPRWGRGQETYGEDPYLTGELGKAIVTGLEGTDRKYLKVSACAKHFAVHSGPESSRHHFDANPDPIDLWNTYLPAFKQLVVDADVSGVMCAYNRLDGEPCCGNSTLMMDILRNKWNFKGYVVSDCGAVSNFWQTHKTEPDAEHAAAAALSNGTDLECGMYWRKLWTYNTVNQALEKGLIDEETINKSLERLFEIRLRLGMFDKPEDCPYSSITIDSLNTPSNKAHALKMARESIVLLKNNGILPIPSTCRKIAVVGPNADDSLALLGNYNGYPLEAVTPFKGISEIVGKKASVIRVKGTEYTEPADYSAQSLDSLKNVDLVIFCGGISARFEGEQGNCEKATGFYSGDRTTIELPAVQTEFMSKIKAMGKRLVVVNMSGGAMAMPWVNDNADAILQAWYPGQDGGKAIADILFGKYNPSGRLPVTFYQSDSDLPDFEDYAMVGRTYRYFEGQPAYDFGYGLSYTKFEYSNLSIQKTKQNSYEVKVKVTNIGSMAGDEVVQLYISPLFIDPRIPIHSLKEFARINLDPGESGCVTFSLKKDAFSVMDEKGEPYIINGEYEISVGGFLPTGKRIEEKTVAVNKLNI